MARPLLSSVLFLWLCCTVAVANGRALELGDAHVGYTYASPPPACDCEGKEMPICDYCKPVPKCDCDGTKGLPPCDYCKPTPTCDCDGTHGMPLCDYCKKPVPPSCDCDSSKGLPPCDYCKKPAPTCDCDGSKGLPPCDYCKKPAPTCDCDSSKGLPPCDYCKPTCDCDGSKGVPVCDYCKKPAPTCDCDGSKGMPVCDYCKKPAPTCDCDSSKGLPPCDYCKPACNEAPKPVTCDCEGKGVPYCDYCRPAPVPHCGECPTPVCKPCPPPPPPPVCKPCKPCYKPQCKPCNEPCKKCMSGVDFTSNDAELLNNMLAVEYLLSDSYSKAASTVKDDGLVNNLIAEFHEQSSAHVKAISGLLKNYTAQKPQFDTSVEVFTRIADAAFGKPMSVEFDAYNSTTNFLLAAATITSPLATRMAVGSLTEMESSSSKAVLATVMSELAGQSAALHTLLAQRNKQKVAPYNVSVSEFSSKLVSLVRSLEFLHTASSSQTSDTAALLGSSKASSAPSIAAPSIEQVKLVLTDLGFYEQQQQP